MTRSLLTALTFLAMAIAASPALGWEASSFLGPPPPRADAFNVDAMLVGDKVLQVTDNRQLTLSADGKVVEVHISPDGRYVVYTVVDNRGEADLHECRLVKISTGKTATIMSRMPADQPISSNQAWTLKNSPAIAWSPDSSMFALRATRVASETGKRTEQEFIVVYSASGAFRKALPFDPPKENQGQIILSQGLRFTPDSRRILANLLIPELASENVWEYKATIRLFDISTGSTRDVALCKLESESPGSLGLLPAPTVVGWSADGSLLFIDWAAGNGKMHKMTLDGKSDEVLRSDCLREEVWSSDGQFAIARAGGLALRGGGRAATVLVADPNATFGAWAPNNKMFLYLKPESMQDADKLRRRDFRSLWLSGLTAGKRGSLCVALDAEESPSASRDCRRIAYVSQGRLQVAELTLRDPTLTEKLAAGLALNEEQTKAALMANGKHIGFGILMYCSHNDGRMPRAEALADSLREHLGMDDVLCRPGTKDNVFKYLAPGKLSDIANPAQAIIGELDAGYSWKVAIYADGHVDIALR